MDLRRVTTLFVSECTFFATDNSRKDLLFNSLGAPKMHPYGLQSAKCGFFFLATAQAPHRGKKLLFIFLPQIQFVSHLSANNLTITRLPGTRSPHTHAAVLYLVQSKYLVPMPLTSQSPLHSGAPASYLCSDHAVL